MRWAIIFLIGFQALAQQHCGYDFTSYLVLHVHEDGKKENIAGLRITIVDESGKEIVNTENRYSWRNKGEVLVFSENYKIGTDGQRVEADAEKFRWFFPFATDTYFLSVTNEFPADGLQVMIQDPLNRFRAETVPIYAYNMYILCTTQAQQAQQFGRKQNKPLEVILSRR